MRATSGTFITCGRTQTRTGGAFSSTSALATSSRRKVRNADSGSRRTRLKIITKNKEVAKEVMAKAKANPATWRAHKEVPHCEAAIEYHVYAGERDTDKELDESETGHVFEADLEKSAAHMIIPQMLAKNKAIATHSQIPVPSAPPPPSTVVDPALQERKQTLKDAQRLKREQAKRDEEDEKDTPQYTARSWMQSLSNDITQCRAQALGVDDTCGLPASVRTEYVNIFESHATVLTTLRGRIADIVNGVGEVSANTLTEAEATVKSYKQDLHAYKRLVGAYSGETAAKRRKAQ